MTVGCCSMVPVALDQLLQTGGPALDKAAAAGGVALDQGSSQQLPYLTNFYTNRL